MSYDERNSTLHASRSDKKSSLNSKSRDFSENETNMYKYLRKFMISLWIGLLGNRQTDNCPNNYHARNAVVTRTSYQHCLV